MTAPTSYIHGCEGAEQRRLEVQHRLLGGASFLPPLRPGMAVLEVGCGTGAISRDIAPSVFPGTVTGVDSPPRQLETARALARDQGLGNVDSRLGRAQSLDFPDSSFDLCYCRFLPEHVPDPVRVVREMARVTRVAGAVAACEGLADGGFSTRPPLPAARKALAALSILQRLRGGDPWVGETLESIFAQAGLLAVRADTLRVGLASPKDVRAFASSGSQLLKDSEVEILDEGLLSWEDLDRAYCEWEGFADAAGAAAMFMLRRVQGKPGRRRRSDIAEDLEELWRDRGAGD